MPYTGPEPARRPLSSDDITDGIVSTADLADSAVTTAKLATNSVTAAKVSSDVSQLGKNLLINGSCSVAQRGSVTGIGGSGDNGTFDRWLFVSGGGATGRVTVSQASLSAADRATTGQGYAMEIDCTTAEVTVAANDIMWLVQRIEAQNLQHLKYGNAAAKTLTLSFWFRSPKTGAHFVAAKQDDGTDTYIREFTIASADTWEKFTVTFPGDPTGTINNDTGSGYSITFPIINGSTYHGTKDTWTGSSSQYSTSDQQNLLDNTANNIYITGVQLEVGSVATDFEHEDYGTTLAKCQRYYFRQTDASLGARIISGIANSSTACQFAFRFLVEMRAAPTLGVSNVAHFLVAYDTTAAATTNIVAAVADVHSVRLTTTTGSATTAGDAVQLGFNGGGTHWFEFSAEL